MSPRSPTRVRTTIDSTTSHRATEAGENDPLLGSSDNDVSADVAPTDVAAGGYKAEMSKRSMHNLDLKPTKRDAAGLNLTYAGLALFLPLTWYYVFSGDLKAMGWFATHPPMQSLAITAFILGIVPLQPPPTNGLTRQSRFSAHQNVILAVALPALAVGTAGMWWNKHIHGAMHFTTWHSWFGIAAVAWVVIQAFVGASSVWFGGKLYGGPAQAKKLYKYHRISGYLMIALFLFTAHLGGAHSTWALGKKGGWMQAVRVGAFWVAPPLIMLGVLVRARGSKMGLA